MTEIRNLGTTYYLLSYITIKLQFNLVRIIPPLNLFFINQVCQDKIENIFDIKLRCEQSKQKISNSTETVQQRGSCRLNRRIEE